MTYLLLSEFTHVLYNYLLFNSQWTVLHYTLQERNEHSNFRKYERQTSHFWGFSGIVSFCRRMQHGQLVLHGCMAHLHLYQQLSQNGTQWHPQFHTFNVTGKERLLFIIVRQFPLNTKRMFKWDNFLPNYGD